MNTETREISLRDRDKIEELRRTCGHVSASHAFASLYIWRVDMGLSICLGEDAFAVKYRLRGDNSWFSHAASRKLCESLFPLCWSIRSRCV